MGELTCTWWGHASATVELGSTRVAIDPLLSDHLFHLNRYTASPGPEAVQADFVVISHLHHDHLHLPSLKRFGAAVPIVVPRGGESLLRGLGSDRVHAVEPGDVLDLAGARITVLGATHDGGRGPQSKATGPALGFRIDGDGRSFWFPGDTELRDDMAMVGHVDLALIPIGGWGPTLEDGHMDPVHGAEAVARVGADVAIPVHWGTFWPLGLRRIAKANHTHLFVTPGDRFVTALAESGSAATALLVEPGQTVTL